MFERLFWIFLEVFEEEVFFVVVVIEFVIEGELFFMIMFSGYFVLVFIGGEVFFVILLSNFCE